MCCYTFINIAYNINVYNDIVKGVKYENFNSGFDPFGVDKVNPALEIIKLLPPKIYNHDIITLEVPTVGYKSLENYRKSNN